MCNELTVNDLTNAHFQINASYLNKRPFYAVKIVLDALLQQTPPTRIIPKYKD